MVDNCQALAYTVVNQPGVQMITMYGEKVRLVSTGNPFKGDDMVVEILEDGEWKWAWSCNSISNDYAHTESVSMARSWMARMAKVAA